MIRRRAGRNSSTTSRHTRSLHAHEITVAHGSHVALHPTTIHLAPGEFIAVTGPSGSGKTSLLWALAGALTPASGTVHWGDQPITNRDAAARAGIVTIPQGNGLATSLTATENALAALLAAGVSPGEAAERADHALTAVGLEESGNHLPEELSGGQQQRVAIARALAAPATVILADEPTSDLDAATRGRIIGLLRKRADDGTSIVMTTNDPDAATHADTKLRLEDGSTTGALPLPTHRPN